MLDFIVDVAEAFIELLIDPLVKWHRRRKERKAAQASGGDQTKS